jgi:outer membrane protein OmpA-like peptidoglycan-associated protein
MIVIALGGLAMADTKPTKGRTVVVDTSIEILDRVTFENDSATLTAKSFPILDAVAATLKGNENILVVEVQSHTDERGDAKHNLDLSQKRAEVVRNYIIAQHIDPARLVAQGYGGTQPVDRGHNAAAWDKNQRVAFLILKRKE